MNGVVFVTGNLNKVKVLNHLLGYEIAHEKLDLDEFQDLDPVAIAKQKAIQAYKILKRPVLIEDTCVVFNALGKLPGPFIKWFLQELGAGGCCKLLDNFTDRSAEARVTFALYNGKDMQIIEGRLSGQISSEPRGARGFGWDFIFIPEGSTKTYGEMDENEYYGGSVRSTVVGQLKELIDKLKA
jgi:non-canonical purine NTP pyrophosphatase (RdgB/HAM1 family)